jgi:hypothetical protein
MSPIHPLRHPAPDAGSIGSPKHDCAKACAHGSRIKSGMTAVYGGEQRHLPTQLRHSRAGGDPTRLGQGNRMGEMGSPVDLGRPSDRGNDGLSKGRDASPPFSSCQRKPIAPPAPANTEAQGHHTLLRAEALPVPQHGKGQIGHSNATMAPSLPGMEAPPPTRPAPASRSDYNGCSPARSSRRRNRRRPRRAAHSPAPAPRANLHRSPDRCRSA